MVQSIWIYFQLMAAVRFYRSSIKNRTALTFFTTIGVELPSFPIFPLRLMIEKIGRNCVAFLTNSQFFSHRWLEHSRVNSCSFKDEI